MNAEKINGYLLALAVMNDGSNYAVDYSFKEIPKAQSPEEATDIYFNHGIWCEDYEFSQDVPENPQWTISLFNSDVEHLRSKLKYWLLQQTYSPKISPFQARNVVANILEMLVEYKNGYEKFKVWQVNNSVSNYFYECTWDDILIEQKGKYFLLHMGLSD